MEMFDENKDNKISWEEFVKALTKLRGIFFMH